MIVVIYHNDEFNYLNYANVLNHVLIGFGNKISKGITSHRLKIDYSHILHGF